MCFYSIYLPLPCTSISIFRIVLFNAQQTLLAHKYPLFWVLVLNSIHCSKINITYITIFYAFFHAIGLGVLSLYWNAYHLLAESLRFTMLKWWSSKTWGTLYIISKTSCFSSTRLSPTVNIKTITHGYLVWTKCTSHKLWGGKIIAVTNIG